MKINAFFDHRLRTPYANHRWSWGAYNQKTNQVFLRNSSWSIDEYDDGKQWMVVYDPNWRASNGHKERLRHLDIIKGGAEGVVVLVEFNDNGKIESFDDETLVRIGNITEEGALIYAEVFGEVGVDELVCPATSRNPRKDIAAIQESVSTTRPALVDARLGQGTFRAEVLRMWDYRCAVTNIGESSVIRASHIKPWKDSNNQERLDPYNGLPLLATLDCLFDAGYIAFDRTSNIIVSSLLSTVDRDKLGLDGKSLRHRPHKETKSYLAYHRDCVFQP